MAHEGGGDLDPADDDDFFSFQVTCEAPTHFATVSELIQLISEWLPDVTSVLQVASVNRKWRRSLLWNDYPQHRRDMWRDLRKHHYHSRRTGTSWNSYEVQDQDMGTTDGQCESFAIHITWVVFYGFLWIFFFVWVASNGKAQSVEISSAGDDFESQRSLLQAQDGKEAAFSGAMATFGIFCGMQAVVPLVLVFTLDSFNCRTQNRISAGVNFGVGILSLIFFLMATVGSDMSTIYMELHHGGVQLSDQQPWATPDQPNTEIPLAQKTVLVHVTDPSGWTQVPKTPIWGTETVSPGLLCDTRHRWCNTQAAMVPRDSATRWQWRYLGPFSSSSDSDSSSSSSTIGDDCENPVIDQFPSRTVFVDVTVQTWRGPGPGRYQVHLGQAPLSPIGVDSVNVVLINTAARTPQQTTTPDGWEVEFFDSHKSNSHQRAKWNQVVLYNLDPQTPVEGESPSLTIRRVSEDQLRSTLLAAPFNLSGSYLNASVFGAAASSSGNRQLLQYWISRAILEDSHQDALAFSQLPDETSGEGLYTHYIRTLHGEDESTTLVPQMDVVAPASRTDTGVASTKKLSWLTTQRSPTPQRVAASDSEVLFWRWIIRLLPHPGNCSYPTLRQNPWTRDHDVRAEPDRIVAGSKIYTSTHSWWYEGRWGFTTNKAVPTNNGDHGNIEHFHSVVPVFGGEHVIPAWCTDQFQADLFFGVSLTLLLTLPCMIMCGVLVLPLWRVNRALRGKTTMKNFKKAGKKWARHKALEQKKLKRFSQL